MKFNSIIFVCSGFGGGIGKMIRYVSGLSLDKFENVYIVHRGKESENDVAPEGVKEYVINISGSNLLLRRYMQVITLRNYIKMISPDVVCCFGSEQAVITALAMKGLKNIKLVQCDRGDPYTLPFVWKVLVKWAFRQADNCVFQLPNQGIWYGKNVMKKSIIIPNAFIPTGDVIPFKGERQKTIVSVGRFVKEKRYDILIEAFRLVHDKYPDYKLVIYGDGYCRNEYLNMIERYRLEDYVEMPGHVENSMNAIQNATVFVLSSFYEGIPNSLIEAMAVGLPTVSTNCTPGGPDFLTNHGERGLLVPVNDIDSMCKAICQIIEDPMLARKLSYESSKIIEILDKNMISGLWLDFFENIQNFNEKVTTN